VTGLTTTLYIGYSDTHFNRRWSYPPRHLAARQTLPVRGATGTFLCGVQGTVSQQPEREYIDKMGTDHICKRCMRARSTVR
jgi:hypothetical protein